MKNLTALTYHCLSSVRFILLFSFISFISCHQETNLEHVHLEILHEHNRDLNDLNLDLEDRIEMTLATQKDSVNNLT